MKTQRLFIIMAIMAWGLLGCGGGGGEETAQTPEAETPDPIVEKTQKIEASTSLSEEDKALLIKWANYQTEYDSSATYTMDDLPDWGNYRKLNLSKLSDEQLNTVIHKLKSTICDCDGCGEGWPLDRCLVVRPECNRGLTMSQQLIGQVRVLSK